MNRVLAPCAACAHQPGRHHRQPLWIGGPGRMLTEAQRHLLWSGGCWLTRTRTV